MEKLGKKIDQFSNELLSLRLELWTKHTFLTWQWWMLVGVCLIFIILFFVFIKKNRLLQTIAFYGIVYILNKNLDDVATALDWYDYRMQLEPIIPTMLPANLFAIPIGLCIIYERFKSWKSFLLVTIIFSGIISYLSLPIMKKVGIYLVKAWGPHWSFLSLLVMACLAKLIVDYTDKLREENN